LKSAPVSKSTIGSNNKSAKRSRIGKTSPPIKTTFPTC
jgi:hypothetical protein